MQLDVLCLLFIYGVLFTTQTKCANILGVFPAPGYSQFILGEKLMTELARRGHNVTVIAPYKPKSEVKNYQTVYTDGILEYFKDWNPFDGVDIHLLKQIVSTYSMGYFLTNYTLSHESVQNLIKSNSKFDIVIVEQFFNEAHMAFAQYYNAPLITFSSLGPCEWTNHLVGRPVQPTIEPTFKTSFTNHMTFWQRTINSFYYIFDQMYKNMLVFPKQQQILEENFPIKMDIYKIMNGPKLLLFNSHITTFGAYSLVSNMIEIGGFHVDPKPLPEKLQHFLNGATDGAILFSMGTNIRSTNFPFKKMTSILKVLGRLKERVLWKFEDKNAIEVPDNVFIAPWLPQQDVLAHPNVKLFVTHGGLLSLTETIYNAVPIVGIPIFGDQRMNVAKAEKNGLGVYLSYKDITEESFFSSIRKVIDDERYMERVTEFSRILKDQEVKPLDRAMFWIEYTLRNGNLSVLTYPGVELYWYQLYMLDILAGFSICALILYYIIKREFLMTFNKSEIIAPKPKEKKKDKKA